MAQLIVDAQQPTLTLITYWQYDSNKTRTTWMEDNGTFEFDVTDLPDGAVVRRATFSAYLGDVKINVNKATIYGKDVKNEIGYGSTSIRVNLRSNRRMTVAVSYKANPMPYQDTNLHYMSWIISEAKLTIVYDTDAYSEPPDEPRMVLEPKHTVKLFAPKTTSFLDNGLCILSPTSCTVTEEAGGDYELMMEHPIDKYGKWELIKEDCIIEAPVPPTYIHEITMPPWEVWQTKVATDLYTTLPSYTKAKSGVDAVQANPSMYAWSSTKDYEAGQFCTYDGKIYRAIRANKNIRPISTVTWSFCAKVIGSGTTDQDPTKPQFKPGVVGETLAAGTLIFKLTDFNETWMQIRTRQSATGYVKTVDCEVSSTDISETFPARTIFTQLFRVYEISGEDDTHSITVKARHISYDLQRNVLYDCQLEEVEPSTAIAYVQGSMINDDETQMQWSGKDAPSRRKIATDMTEPLVTVNWSYQNPIQALLDPEEGLAGKLKAKVIRDNTDIFLLDNSAPRRGITISYGVNLKGVTWTRNIQDVITRVIPRAQNKDGKYIYLDELYVDSDAIDEYAVISTEVLDCKWKEGQQITHLDGSTTTLSLSDVMEKMLSEAEDRFQVDHCDAVNVALDVEFLMLGDTEEFKQYRNLQRLQIYDVITINTGVSKLRTQAQVSGYEWDCIAGRYNSIKIGQVYQQSRRRLPGYRLASGAITYSKLAPDLISYIKGAE